MQSGAKVAVIGAAGGIGQSLSMLLKLTAGISELALIDVGTSPTPIKGVMTDLSHINTSTSVRGYITPDELEPALSGASIVIITAGCMMLKPGMNRDALFESSAGLIASIAQSCAKYCKSALLAIITNPVNSMVPIFIETQRKLGILNPEKRVFGVTTLDVVRASSFTASASGADPKVTKVPVIGGHGGESILALVSQTSPACTLSTDQQIAVEKRVMDGANEVILGKNGSGSATLSMAYAAKEFCVSLLSALESPAGVADFAYVSVAGLGVGGLSSEDEYFAGLCTIGPEGVRKMDDIPVGKLTAFEIERFEQARAKCRVDVKAAYKYINNH